MKYDAEQQKKQKIIADRQTSTKNCQHIVSISSAGRFNAHAFRSRSKTGYQSRSRDTHPNLDRDRNEYRESSISDYFDRRILDRIPERINHIERDRFQRPERNVSSYNN